MKNIFDYFIERKKKRYLDDVLKAKRLFDDTVQQALQDSGGLSKTASDAKAYADAEFKQLLQEANQAASGFDKLAARANEIAQYRAYVMPTSELYIESRSLIDEMREWGIPIELLSSLEGLILDRAIQNKEMQARHNLYRIINAYDYWDWYVDWYSNTLNRVNLVLFILMASILLRAYNTEENYFSFLMAGLSGAVASVILKSPPLSAYGHFLSFYGSFFVRIASGFIASAVCFGLLASKIVNIGNIASYTEDYLSIDYTSKVILISIGILTGFSERAIYSFSSVFETSIAARRDKKKTKGKQDEGKT
ncbi:MAG: hypothetical protein HY279_06800 [Nitrospinae bacterium]|nr:hypothetical protein [Nitrospinota bacterium]